MIPLYRSKGMLRQAHSFLYLVDIFLYPMVAAVKTIKPFPFVSIFFPNVAIWPGIYYSDNVSMV